MIIGKSNNGTIIIADNEAVEPREEHPGGACVCTCVAAGAGDAGGDAGADAGVGAAEEPEPGSVLPAQPRTFNNSVDAPQIPLKPPRAGQLDMSPPGT